MTVDLAGSRVVVTGGGRGIAAAKPTASDIGGHAVPGDAAGEEGLEQLVSTCGLRGCWCPSGRSAVGAPSSRR